MQYTKSDRTNGQRIFDTESYQTSKVEDLPKLGEVEIYDYQKSRLKKSIDDYLEKQKNKYGKEK